MSVYIHDYDSVAYPSLTSAVSVAAYEYLTIDAALDYIGSVNYSSTDDIITCILTRSITLGEEATIDSNLDTFLAGYTPGEVPEEETPPVQEQDDSDFINTIGQENQFIKQSDLDAAGITASELVTLAANDNDILNGLVAPINAIGNDGDFYIHTTVSDLYGPKTGGSWGAPTSLIGAAGSDGTDGTDGNTVLNGIIDPLAGVGVDGDFYINRNTLTIFGPKTGGGWPSGTSMVGEGLPSGGTANQLIRKVDGTDYNTEWYDFKLPFIQFQKNGTQALTTNNLAPVINYEIAEFIDTDYFTFAPVSGEVTILEDGFYQIDAYFDVIGNAGFASRYARIAVIDENDNNLGSVSSQVCTFSNTNTTTNGSVCMAGLKVQLTANTVIHFEATANGGNCSIVGNGNGNVSITKIG